MGIMLRPRAAGFRRPGLRTSFALWGTGLGAGLIMGMLTACEDPDADRTPPTLIVESPAVGAVFSTGDTVLLRFRCADETQLETWVINVRNERIGNSVYATSGLTPNLDPDDVQTVEDRFVVDTGLDTEFLVEFEAIDAEQNETIEKRSFFEEQ